MRGFSGSGGWAGHFYEAHHPSCQKGVSEDGEAMYGGGFWEVLSFADRRYLIPFLLGNKA